MQSFTALATSPIGVAASLEVALVGSPHEGVDKAGAHPFAQGRSTDFIIHVDALEP